MPLPRRLSITNLAQTQKAPKRIIICCDGTWQDGISQQERAAYTNILRLSRTIQLEDNRTTPPTPQIVLYQSGIGSNDSLYSKYVEGSTGGSLGDKVEEAYAFIAQNYQMGDEIFLFGFSRGAYTARMVAMFIGAIGILNRRDMDNFATIFLTYQKLGKSTNQKEIDGLRATLTPWTKEDSPGKIRGAASQSGSIFSIKCLGVFDTVGALGLPQEVTPLSQGSKNIFGFPDKILGEHVERAYQALAIDERRSDFDCAKFEQTAKGKQERQILKQCWFTGCHSDIGGGYTDHDLADLTLTWMAAQVGDAISLDNDYLFSNFQPAAGWGKLKPHDSSVGIFTLARNMTRTYPAGANEVTKETIHPSVLQQDTINPNLKAILDKHPELVTTLAPLEEELKSIWPKLLRSKPAAAKSNTTTPAHI